MLRGYLELLRPANVVTAIADVLAGYAVAGRSAIPRRYPGWSAPRLCLYAGGVVLNDFFDRGWTRSNGRNGRSRVAESRQPTRAALGTTLLVLGVAAASQATRDALFVAVAIAAFVVLYDARTKRHPVAGPISMGLCRGLNLLLGVSASSRRVVGAAGPSGCSSVVYIAAVTAVSRGEVHGGRTVVATVALISLGGGRAGLLSGVVAGATTGRRSRRIVLVAALRVSRAASLLARGEGSATRRDTRSRESGRALAGPGRLGDQRVVRRAPLRGGRAGHGPCSGRARATVFGNVDDGCDPAGVPGSGSLSGLFHDRCVRAVQRFASGHRAQRARRSTGRLRPARTICRQRCWSSSIVESNGHIPGWSTRFAPIARRIGRRLTLAGPVLVVPGRRTHQERAATSRSHRRSDQRRRTLPAFLRRRHRRRGVLDVVGYAAATAHRGVRLIRVPTTVLSQDDSAIGVKNGVNAFGKKNYLGTFAPPFAVINDFAFSAHTRRIATGSAASPRR